MSIYIPGMEVPEDGMLEFVITDKGVVILTSRSIRVDGDEYFEPLITPQELYRAIPVPEHGRLIDADALINANEKIYDNFKNGDEISTHEATIAYLLTSEIIRRAKTIIPASKEGEG